MKPSKLPSLAFLGRVFKKKKPAPFKVDSRNRAPAASITQITLSRESCFKWEKNPEGKLRHRATDCDLPKVTHTGGVWVCHLMLDGEPTMQQRAPPHLQPDGGTGGEPPARVTFHDVWNGPGWESGVCRRQARAMQLLLEWSLSTRPWQAQWLWVLPRGTKASGDTENAAARFPPPSLSPASFVSRPCCPQRPAASSSRPRLRLGQRFQWLGSAHRRDGPA